MIPLAVFKEKSFKNLNEFTKELGSKERRDFWAPAKELSVGIDGTISGPRFKNRLSETGMETLLYQLRIPEEYANHICPDDLIVDSINRLLNDSDGVFRVRTLSDIVTSVLHPATDTVDYHLIVKHCLGDINNLVNITLSEKMLRITTVTRSQIEVIPDDKFKIGWEVINSEDGFYQLQANIFLYRLVCSNGAYDFKNLVSFSHGKNASISQTLSNLRECITKVEGEDVLKNALQRANQERVGVHFEQMKKEITSRIGKESWDLNFSEVNPEASWYALFNQITLTAQRYQLYPRRMYESLGGEVLSFFFNPGDRRRTLIKRAICDKCELTNAVPTTEQLGGITGGVN